MLLFCCVLTVSIFKERIMESWETWESETVEFDVEKYDNAVEYVAALIKRRQPVEISYIHYLTGGTIRIVHLTDSEVIGSEYA